MRDFIRVMKALSEPSRVKILKMLTRRELCVCELQAGLGLAQPTVSKHLRILEDAGLVEKRKEGLWMNYRPANGHSSPYAATLLGSLKHWLNDDPEIQALMLKVPNLDRAAACARSLEVAR